MSHGRSARECAECFYLARGSRFHACVTFLVGAAAAAVPLSQQVFVCNSEVFVCFSFCLAPQSSPACCVSAAIQTLSGFSFSGTRGKRRRTSLRLCLILHLNAGRPLRGAERRDSLRSDDVRFAYCHGNAAAYVKLSHCCLHYCAAREQTHQQNREIPAEPQLHV